MTPAATTRIVSKSLDGFGFPEQPTAIEVCDHESYPDHIVVPTDLYCNENHFLPFSRMKWSIRVIVVTILVSCVWLGFELTAQFNSLVPVDLIYALIGLYLTALPLRHFRRTCGIATALWVAVSTISLLFRFAGTNFRVGIVTTLLFVMLVATTCHAIFRALTVSLGGDASKTRRQDLGKSSVFGAVALITAAGCGLADIGLRMISYVWSANESGIVHRVFIMALIALTSAAILMIAAGLMRAVRNVDTRVPRIPRPEQPKLVKWGVRLPRLRQYRTRNVVDRTAEVLRQVIFHVLDFLLITVVAGARIATNCPLIAVYVMKRFLVAVANLFLKIAILTMRWLAIALASIAGLSYRAFSTAVTACLFTLASVGLPLCTLVGAGWLVTASAEQTRRYLLAGPLVELLHLVGLISLAVALLTIAWIMLAGQCLRDSLQSAKRTLPYAIAYGILLTATGGWLLGLLEKIGYGQIHFGDATFASTVLTVAAVPTIWLLNRIRHDAGEDGADREEAGPIPPPRYSSADFGHPPRQPGSRPGSYSDPAWSRPSQAPDNVKRWFVLTLVVLATLALSVWVGPGLVSASGHSLASSQHTAVKAHPPSHRAHGRVTPQATTPASAVHPSAPESTGARTASVRVPADTQDGVNTGIYAVQGGTIVITGRGSGGYGYEGTQGCLGSPTTHPGGSRYVGRFNCGPKDDPNAVLSGAAIGLLIARIGGGTWFGVGTGTTFTAGGNGYIYLAYNDSVYSDNTGSYSATVTYNRRRAQR